MDKINKKDMSETDIRTKYITPSIINSGWDIENQVREEFYYTAGQITVSGKISKRGKGKKVDYILYFKYPSIPLAVIEAKDNTYNIGDGMQQALDYADDLNILFAYSSNGDGFVEHDKITGKEKQLSLEEFPSPEELFARYKTFNNIGVDQEKIISTPYFFDTVNPKPPRYYQVIAINKTVEAISKGTKRILLVMATGTGKTFTAFQIIHRLWTAKNKRRILFLADRNILVDQTMTNDFKSFTEKMVKIKRGQTGKEFEIYLGLYQSLTGPNEEDKIFKTFSPEFFDLIVVDECHRGSADENKSWREILTYFNNATQIGLTATPKETAEVSNINYFGEPIYTYSLRQGIEDGFLAPYKLVRYFFDKDLEGFIPEKNQLDKYGNLIPSKKYEGKDFDRNLILELRTKLVAQTVTEYLKLNGDRFAKTIIFCVDIAHAERMRQELINLNSDLLQENSKYIMKITGDDDIGKAQLDNFIDPNSKYPVIVTTSELLATGVDAQTCKYIVLDKNIGSMTEFKQIIGRGTRINVEYGKTFFTILDFRNVSTKFFEPEFDGDIIMDPDFPVGSTRGETSGEIKDDGVDGEIIDGTICIPPEERKEQRIKYYLDNVQVEISGKIEQFLDENGKLTTKSVIDFTKETFDKRYSSFDEFLNDWNRPILKKEIIENFEQQNINFDILRVLVPQGDEMDEFDLICHLVFNRPAVTKKDRAKKLKQSNYFDKYSDVAKKVLDNLIEKYVSTNVSEIETIDILRLDEFKKIGSPMRILESLGCEGRSGFENIIINLESELYKTERGGVSVNR